MSILVVCPGCKKSFRFKDQFAGKSGRCSECKAIIHVPKKSEEVKIHGGEQFDRGGRDAAGQLVLKPIARKQVRFEPVVTAAVAGSTVCLLAVTWAAGKMELIQRFWAVRAIGLLLVSPALVIAAYTFLRDDELEPYRGLPLLIRSAACAAAYAVLWALLAYVLDVVQPGIEIYLWMIIAIPPLVLGSLAAWLSLDLEPTNGFFHYGFYLLVTMVLGWVGGLGWVWEAPRGL
jgi:hypothetical protein